MKKKKNHPQYCISNLLVKWEMVMQLRIIQALLNHIIAAISQVFSQKQQWQNTSTPVPYNNNAA